MALMADPIDDPEPPLPAELQRQLRQLFAPRVEIPASIGAALRAAAHRRRQPLVLRPLPLAAAATLLVALSLTFALQHRAASGIAGRADFDHSGRVDILDA